VGSQPVAQSSLKTGTTISAGSVYSGATVDARSVRFWLFFGGFLGVICTFWLEIDE
jgi:hypothetical protein